MMAATFDVDDREHFTTDDDELSDMDDDEDSDMDDYEYTDIDDNEGSDVIDEFTGVETYELAELEQVLGYQVEAFVTQAYDEDIRPLEITSAVKSLLNSIAVTLQMIVQRSPCLQMRCWDSLFRSLIQLSPHPQGFTMSVDFLLQLIEKHCINDTILKPWVRTPGEELLFAKMLLDECEFKLICMIAMRSAEMSKELETDICDASLVLHDFLEKHTSTESVHTLDFIPRLVVYSRKRHVGKMVASKAVGHLLPAEILEIVQDSMYDDRVEEVISSAIEAVRGDLRNVGFKEASKWLQDTFNEFEL